MSKSFGSTSNTSHQDPTDPFEENRGVIISYRLHSFHQQLAGSNVNLHLSTTHSNQQAFIEARSRAAKRNGSFWRTLAFSSTILAGMISFITSVATSLYPNEVTASRVIWMGVSVMTVGVGMLGLSTNKGRGAGDTELQDVRDRED